MDRYLREALRAGLLREAAVIPERRYAFTQSLIHEAAARSLLLRRRREIHVQVGWALEEVYADNLEGQYGELARHFWEGESWERAFRYSRLAAEQAAAAFANDEAVVAFTMALESAERSAAGASPKVVAMLAERRADVRALMGEYDAALKDYRAAMEYHLDALKDATDPAPEQDADPARARFEGAIVGSLALRMARLLSYQGQLDLVRSKLEHALTYLPPDSPDLSSAWSLKAGLYTWETDMEKAAEAGRKALEIARERGSFQHLGEAYEALTHPSMMGVLGMELADLADEWIGLARERPEDRQFLFKALTARGLVEVWVFWTFDEAMRAQTLEALEIAQATGSVAGENTARGILGAGQFLLGEWQAAETELRSAAGQATTLLGVGAIYEWWLMLLLTLRGEAHTAADQMEIWLQDTRNTHRQVLMGALLGFNRLVARDEDGARSAIARASEAASTLGCAQCNLTLDQYASEVLAELGDAEAAAPHIANARVVGERHGRRSAVLAADRAEAVLALANGQAGTARDLVERARQCAEQLGQPFEIARTLLLLADVHDATGNPFAAASHRLRAQELLDQLGATPITWSVRRTSAPRLQV
jgi:tetratricopeptide (TPR) repeat protein